MRLIGTTENGILLEATPEELLTVDAAIQTLMEWRAMCAVQELAPRADQSPRPPAASPARRRPATAPARPTTAAAPAGQTDTKTCSICKTAKPLADFYAVGSQCKICLRAKRKEEYRAEVGPAKPKQPRGVTADEAFRPKHHALSGRVKKAPVGVRERDPLLDRPQDGSGRTLQVGPQD